MSETEGLAAGTTQRPVGPIIDEVLGRHFGQPDRAGGEALESRDRVGRAMQQGLERYFSGISRDAAWEEILARAGKAYEVVDRQRLPHERGAGTFDLDIWVIADLVRSLGLPGVGHLGHHKVAAAIADNVLAWSHRRPPAVAAPSR